MWMRIQGIDTCPEDPTEEQTEAMSNLLSNRFKGTFEKTGN